MQHSEPEYRALTASLIDSIKLLNGALDISTVMDRILVNVGRVVPHDFANIMLILGDFAYIKYWRGYPTSYKAFFEQVEFPLQTPNLAAMLHNARPYIIPNTRNFSGWIPASFFRHVNSYVGAPIRIRNEIIGFLNLESEGLDFFTATHAERLQIFADHAAIAIDNAQLYDRARQYAAKLEQRVAERTAALSEANKRLQHLDILKTKFIADASHELRTPAANLNLRIYLLEHDSPERWSWHLGVLKREVAMLNQLIENLLDFSHFEAQVKNGANVFAPVDMREVVNKAISLCATSAELKGLSLEFPDEGTALKVCGDSQKLNRVLTNLLFNAIRYTPAGHVAVRLWEANNQICVSVKDTGMGISATDLPHLFERFYRGRQVGSMNIPGSGLGLSIAKEIVDLHGGTIEVASTLGQGSEFRVFLPTKPKC